MLNPGRDKLCVAMLDIDKFKSISDNYALLTAKRQGRNRVERG